MFEENGSIRLELGTPADAVTEKAVTVPVQTEAEAPLPDVVLTEEEQKGARKTLTAAAMTYVAATAVSLAQLLRLLLIFGRRDND